MLDNSTVPMLIFLDAKNAPRNINCQYERSLGEGQVGAPCAIFAT